MINPGNTTFTGVVGGTFTTSVTLYQNVPASIWGGIWQTQQTYQPNTIVIGSNGIAYLSTTRTSGANPTQGGPWTVLETIDLTEYTGVFQINKPNTTPSATGTVTLGGTDGVASISVTAADMAAFPAGEYPCYLQVTDNGGNVFYPLIATIVLISPLSGNSVQFAGGPNVC